MKLTLTGLEVAEAIAAYVKEQVGVVATDINIISDDAAVSLVDIITDVEVQFEKN